MYNSVLVRHSFFSVHFSFNFRPKKTNWNYSEKNYGFFCNNKNKKYYENPQQNWLLLFLCFYYTFFDKIMIFYLSFKMIGSFLHGYVILENIKNIFFIDFCVLVKYIKREFSTKNPYFFYYNTSFFFCLKLK